MTLDTAIRTAKALQFSADEDFPSGYDAATVKAQATEILGVIFHAVDTSPDPVKESKRIMGLLARKPGKQ